MTFWQISGLWKPTTWIFHRSGSCYTVATEPRSQPTPLAERLFTNPQNLTRLTNSQSLSIPNHYKSLSHTRASEFTEVCKRVCDLERCVTNNMHANIHVYIWMNSYLWRRYVCLWLPMPVHECARVHVDVLHNVHAFMRVLSVCVCVFVQLCILQTRILALTYTCPQIDMSMSTHPYIQL